MYGPSRPHPSSFQSNVPGERVPLLYKLADPFLKALDLISRVMGSLVESGHTSPPGELLRSPLVFRGCLEFLVN